ncbi:MAG: hypothetical protein HWE27_05760 [Gammaproteobacteria bacterium]|nr:hypothetical protein [Gammaproteobacteria bacterium]
MEIPKLSGIGFIFIATVLVIWGWYDAIINDPSFKTEFKKRFRKGLRLGFLLSLAGIGIGFAGATKEGFEHFNLIRFVVTSLLSGTIATLEIAILNGLNPNPKHLTKSFLEKFVTFGWAIAIGLVGFTAIFLPYHLIAFIFS